MKNISRIIFIISFLALFTHAATLPQLPYPPAWADTEEAVEVGFAPFNGTQSEFRITLAFDATPTNSLEFAIWENALGVVDEPEAVLGWRYGKLFLELNGVRAFCDFIPDTEKLVVRLASRLSGDGKSSQTEITANGVPLVFYDSEDNAVEFGFVPAWDMVRLTSRGTGAKNERVSFGFSSYPGIIIVR